MAPIVIPWVLWGLAAVFLGGGSAAVFFLRKLRGRKVCLLGDRAVGKTTLAVFMSTGKIPRRKEYEQTMVEEAYEGWKIDIGRKTLNVEGIRDLPGGKEHKGAWKAAVDSSDTAIFLFRADLILSGDLDVNRMNSDVEHIRGWLNSGDQHKTVCLVGTHCDLIPEFVASKKSTQGALVDRLLATSPLKETRRRLACDRVVFGSLKNTKLARKLVIVIAKELTMG